MAARKEPEYLYIPEFPIPIYNGKVLLCVTPDEWASVAAAYDSDPDTEACKGLSIKHFKPEEGRIYVIGVFDRTIDTFVHELAHATFHLLGDVGLELEDGGANECFTYVIGWMMREIYPEFQRRINQQKSAS
jgi:hypothetical protein